MKAPMRAVLDIKECEGPRGGKILVLRLECGHWMTRRKPAERVPCIGCCVFPQAEAQEKK